MKIGTWKARANRLWDFYCSFSGAEANSLQLGLSAVSGLLVSGFKIIVGLFTGSAIWVFSGFYDIGLCAARFLFLRDIVMEASSEQRAKTVRIISIILMVVAYFFDIGAMARQFQGDLGTQMPLWLMIPISIYLFTSYVLAIIGLFRTRKNKSLPFYAFRVICISGALINIVLLQRMVLSATTMSLDRVVAVNSVFSYSIGATLMITAVILMIRASTSKTRVS